MNTLLQKARDPVCGMMVDPATAKHHYDHGGRTWYFCAENCLEQFKADPEKYIAKEPAAAQTKRPAIGREILVATAIFAAVVLLLIMIRGVAKSDNGQTVRSSVTGSTAGQHEAIDDGSGGVIVSAKHERAGEFIVSLNTHTVDLTTFNPSGQVRLHDGANELTPQTTLVDGDTSSHHQNYRVIFPDPGHAAVTLSIHDVAGVSERKLPFNL